MMYQTKPDYSTTRSLLQHYVEMLGLNRYKAWPSKVQDTKDAIKQWRSEQRMKLVEDR